MTDKALFSFVRLRPARRGKTTSRADGRTAEETEIVANLITMRPDLFHSELIDEATRFYEAKHAARREQLANERGQNHESA